MPGEGSDSTVAYRSAIRGYDPREWVQECKWSADNLSDEDRAYYKQVEHDYAVMLTTTRSTQLRHIRGCFETYRGPVDLSRLGMSSWRTLVISFRALSAFSVHLVSEEVFVSSTDLASNECPTHIQSMIIATPLAAGDPKRNELRETDIRKLFLGGRLDVVDGAVVDPRVPNQSAQVATKEYIEARIRPAQQTSKFIGRGKFRGKLTFEEQTAPKPPREMCTPVALGPEKLTVDPKIASSNLDKLLARAHETRPEDGNVSCEGTRLGGFAPKDLPPEMGATTIPGPPSDSGSRCSENDADLRSSKSFGKPKTKRNNLGFTPVPEVREPSTFHKRFKPSVKAAALPFNSDAEREAARQFVNLKETEYEVRLREKLKQEEAERKRNEEEMEKRIQAEEEERARGLQKATELLQRKREQEARRRMEERRLREAEEAARVAQEQRRQEEQEQRRQEEEQRIWREEEKRRREEKELKRRQEENELERRRQVVEERRQKDAKEWQEAVERQRQEKIEAGANLKHELFELEEKVRRLEIEREEYFRVAKATSHNENSVSTIAVQRPSSGTPQSDNGIQFANSGRGRGRRARTEEQQEPVFASSAARRGSRGAFGRGRGAADAGSVV